ncbi:uncharacterized protein LOC113462769 [Phoenix dactylifera]|uniref:Uncharacterized protein LOC113462769 n=1 Tax=Phoenix dactylifera TaxID=42345 RepID=A0A8B9AK71_PHODC|nr:uncharacterized protein LOC113462769 [Phoenix dactylifera]
MWRSLAENSSFSSWLQTRAAQCIWKPKWAFFEPGALGDRLSCLRVGPTLAAERTNRKDPLNGIMDTNITPVVGISVIITTGLSLVCPCFDLVPGIWFGFIAHMLLLLLPLMSELFLFSHGICSLAYFAHTIYLCCNETYLAAQEVHSLTVLRMSSRSGWVTSGIV